MLNTNPSPHSDPELLTRFQQELTRVAAVPGLAPAGPALWPRFAGYYERLARLPRKARRALQRRWRRSLGGIALLCALGQAPALAATITVDGTSCTLVDAITAANINAPAGGCTAGSAADTLVLPAGSTHTLTQSYDGGPNGLPLVTSAIIIAGNGSTITRNPGAPQFRILQVAGNGVLTLQETTVSGGVLPGFDRGGCIANNGGVLTLTNSTVSGNRAGAVGGAVYNFSGALTLTNSTISGNADAGVFNRGGTLTLTNSTVSGNTFGGVSSLGGVADRNTATLTNSTVSGNLGVGVKNDSFSTLTITNSTISGNRGAGVDNRGTLFMLNSTISGNSFGGVDNSNTSFITDSTISGNSGSSSGGGVNNRSFLTLRASTVSGNSAASGGGLFNCGSAKLTRSLVSGNSAGSGAEIFDNGRGLVGGPCGRVIANYYNLFGHDGVAGVQGFTPGETDLVGQSPLSATLNPTLADNGGPTKTHALVVASPAVDAVPSPPAGPCVRTTDQRGAPRPQDCDGNTGADCDIGAFELGARPVEALPAAQNPKVRCTPSRCDIRIQCNLALASGAQCTNRIDIFVSRSAARLSEPASTKAPGIRFAFGVTNVPPGETRNVRLRPTKRGKKIIRTSTRRSLRGVLEIRTRSGLSPRDRSASGSDNNKARPPVLVGAHGRVLSNAGSSPFGCARRYPHPAPPPLGAGEGTEELPLFAFCSRPSGASLRAGRSRGSP